MKNRVIGMLLGVVGLALSPGLCLGQTAEIQNKVKEARAAAEREAKEAEAAQRKLAEARAKAAELEARAKAAAERSAKQQAAENKPKLAAAGGDTKKAGNLEAEVRALSARIDELINKQLKEAGVQPAPAADNAHYFRRLNLDLVGKIPNLIDSRDFLDDPTPNKRWLWVERMLEGEMGDKGEAYANHFANIWRAQMIVTSNNFQVQGFLPPFENWLRERLQKNTAYDKMVKELLTGQLNAGMQGFGGGGIGPGGGNISTAAFYFANENKPENLAGATSKLFLGVKLECAQCHKHPFATWKREQFWEFAAFFSGVNQQFRGGIQPAQVNGGGRQIQIPGLNKTVKAKFLDGTQPQWKDNVDSRAVLADWIISKNNPYFAKATVDMVWQYFFGLSLLEPIAEPHDDNPITHPELLDELAKQFVAHNYDLKFLIRAIIHSDAYQRSSVPAGKANPEDLHRDLHLYARMPVRGMSPEQFFDSLAEATDYKQGPLNQNNFRNNPFNQPITPRSEFLAKFANQDNRNETQTSILQALFMMNGKFLAKRTKLDLSLTIEKLAGLSDSQKQDINVSLHTIALQNTPIAQKIDTLYMLVLSRQPRPDEAARMIRYVEGGGPSNDQRQAIADVYWALVNSGEFMLVH